jgi:hypothetical protein
MDKIKELLSRLAPIIKESEEKQEKRMETGFNLFYLISDHYYRETFHSDIIAALLSPNEKHGGENLYLDLFLDMIGVDKAPYKNAKVCKEYGTNDGTLGGRIDIFIEGENKHCVVIENKLNNAGDTCRQLPKYYGYLKNKYTIDKFVYLPLNPYKTPDKSDWSDEERKIIDDRLIIIPAYQEGRKNLIENWLIIAEKETITENEDARIIIKQYITVLRNLTIDIMSATKLESFYNEMIKGDNLETALSVRDMLNNLPEYMAKRIVDKYSSNYEPFEKVFLFSTSSKKAAVLHEAKKNDISFSVDIYCNELGYEIVFFNRQGNIPEEDFAYLKISLKDALNGFEKRPNVNNQYELRLGFNEEVKVQSFIDSLLKELRL